MIMPTNNCLFILITRSMDVRFANCLTQAERDAAETDQLIILKLQDNSATRYKDGIWWTINEAESDLPYADNADVRLPELFAVVMDREGWPVLEKTTQITAMPKFSLFGLQTDSAESAIATFITRSALYGKSMAGQLRINNVPEKIPERPKEAKD